MSTSRWYSSLPDVCFQDLGMNSMFNPKNKGRRLHRPEDCCETCPEPIDDDERKLQTDEDEKYIRGRIKFIEENPGRQTISGSFNPIDVGEWSEQVYLKPTQQLFVAIAAHDRTTVQKLLKDGINLNQRDHVGRTSLHIAILAKATDLIEGGARITARLVSEDDWSSPSDEDIEMVDAADVEDEGDNDDADDDDGDENDEGDDDGDEEDGDSDEKDGTKESDNDEGDDDEGSNDDEAHSGPEVSQPTGDIPEEDDLPHIIDSNLLDWDFGFSALSYAVVFASVPLIQALIGAGADIKVPTKEDEEDASRVAECLIAAGATSTTANDKMWTIFHSVVSSGKARLLATILRCYEHSLLARTRDRSLGSNGRAAHKR